MHCLRLEGLGRQSWEKPWLQSCLRALHIWKQGQVENEAQEIGERAREGNVWGPWGKPHPHHGSAEAHPLLLYFTSLWQQQNEHVFTQWGFFSSFENIINRIAERKSFCSFIKHGVVRIKRFYLRSFKIKIRHWPFAKCKDSISSHLFFHTQNPRKNCKKKKKKKKKKGEERHQGSQNKRFKLSTLNASIWITCESFQFSLS